MTISRVKPSNWATGEKLTSTEMNAVDTNGAKALDKTSAGDTLSGEISVASTGGLTFASGSHASFESGSLLESSPSSTVWLTLGIDGWMELQSGSYVNVSAGQIRTSGTGTIKWNNNDWPLLNTRTRSISRNFRELSIADPNLFPTDWQSSSFGFISGMASAEILALRVPLHEGARLIGMAVYMKAAAHAGVPATMPRVEFFKRTKFGATSASEVHSYPTPLLAAWNNVNITDWSITLTTPQTIDSVMYDYSIDFYDEHGANSVSGNRYYAIEFLYDSITNMRFQ